MALPIARRGTVGVAPHPGPCISTDVQNSSASKTEKVKSTFKKKSQNLSNSCGFHAKSRTGIGCWSVHSLGS